MPAPTSSLIAVHECHQDARPGVHLLSLGLLQLTAVQHQRRTTRHLQSVQNAAARLVTGARRCDHITPELRQLHWLPVRQRVVFKIVGLVHQSLAGATPAYLADDFCRTLVVAQCSPTPMTHGSCSCHEHTTNSAIGVSRPPVSDSERPSTWTTAAGTYLRLL